MNNDVHAFEPGPERTPPGTEFATEALAGGSDRRAVVGPMKVAVWAFLRRKTAAMTAALRRLWGSREETFEDLAARLDAALDEADVMTDRLLDLGARKRLELQGQIDFLLRQAREADATIEARSLVAAQQDRLREIVRQVRQAAQTGSATE